MLQNKIVVFDDDPTGIQCVHGVIAYTKFDEETLLEAFNSPYELIFLSTNSRSMLPKESENLHSEIMENLFAVSMKTGIRFSVISRGDSTLRGHYPLESETIKAAYKKHGILVDGEIICPFLSEIRKTVDDIHYCLIDGKWIKCGDSEFAKDMTFSYKSSDLKEYIKEKYKEEKKCLSFSPSMSEKEVIDLLNEAKNDTKIIVNASSAKDVEYFCSCLKKVQNKVFLARTAANFVKAFANVEDIEYLSTKDLLNIDGKGILIAAGSYVNKTTKQLNYLTERIETQKVEFLLDSLESDNYAREINEVLNKDKICLFYTSRNVRSSGENKQDSLIYSRNVSKRFTSVLQSVNRDPRLIISKGGITSYDVLTNGLKASKMLVLGQVMNAVPCVKLLDGPFKNSSVIVFPGNVGHDESIYNILKDI